MSFITSILPSVKSEIDHQNHFLSRLSFEKLFSVYSEVLTAYNLQIFHKTDSRFLPQVSPLFDHQS